MKNFNTFTFIFAVLMMSSMMGNAQNKTGEGKLLRHVVLLKFKDSALPADVKKVEEAFVGLKKKIKLIKDRDAYLVHPDHQAFVEILKPHLDKVTVVDYWTK